MAEPRNMRDAMSKSAEYWRIMFEQTEGIVEPLRRENARLREALARVRDDLNWMLNERKPLNPGVSDYVDSARSKGGG